MTKMETRSMTCVFLAALTAASVTHVSLEDVGVGQHVQLGPHPVVGSLGSSRPQTLTTLSTNPSSY